MAETKRITRAEDLEKIHALTRALIGEVCWQAILTYPSQLQLHWGEQLSYKSEGLQGEYRGSCIFGVESSSWTLRCDGQVASSDDDDSVLQKKIRILERAGANAFEVSYPDLAVTMGFTNGCTLLVMPDPKRREKGVDENPIPDWTLFSPDGMWLGVGPGLVWRHQRADEPFL